MKYWNGYSWREWVILMLSDEPVNEARSAPITEVPITSDLAISPDEKPEPSDCDHSGEPCVIGGPKANHAW